MRTHFIFLLIFISVLQNAYAQQPLVFTGIKGSVNSDISMKVLKVAYKKLGIDIKYKPLPGERALRTSNSGKVDGEVFRIANVSKRYKNLIQIPTAINTLPAIAHTKNKNVNVSSWKSLKPFKLGIQGGIKFAQRNTKGMNPTVVDSNDQLFKMLDSGRIEVAIAAQSNGIKAINALKLKNIITLKPPIDEYPLFHYLHKKNAHLVTKLDTILKEMSVSGEIKSIREKHLQQL